MNYEALGKYTEAVEKAHKLKDDIRFRLIRLNNRTSSSLSAIDGDIKKKKLSPISVNEIYSSITELKQKSSELDVIINQINVYSDLCGKEKIY